MSVDLDRETLRQMILQREWFHCIELDDDLVTPGRIPLDELKRLTERVNLPQDLSGKTVLDIGAWDGFFSFEAERRGAKRVLAIDVVPISYTGFELAREYLGSQVEYQQLSVYDLAPEKLGQFDVVLFFGVLYHLRYPVLGVDRVWQVVKPGGDLYLESACLDNYVILDDQTVDSLAGIDPDLSETALLQFYRFDELNPGDFSNWFSFSHKAIADILASAGFQVQSMKLWGHRIGVHATKASGKPEYARIYSYEREDYDNFAPYSEEELAEFRRRRNARMRRSDRKPASAGDTLDEAYRLLITLQRSRVYRLMRIIKKWGWLEEGIDNILKARQRH